jgi:hypothetical protein
VKSLRYALIGTAALLALFLGVAVLSEMAAARVTPGRELAFGWRLASWLAVQITVFVPFLFVPIGLVASIGALRSPAATLVQERRLLGWWLVVGVAAPVLAVASFAAVVVPALFQFVIVGAVFINLGMVAWLAAIVVAVHLQSRLAAQGARIQGWHVALVSVPLLLLKPAALIPPAIVWWMSRARRP